MTNFGFPCEYVVIQNDTFCMDGTVRTCGFQFLTCYNVSDTLVRFLQAAGGSALPSTLVSTYCLGNGSTVMQNTSLTDIACDAALTFNASVGWQFFLVGANLACLSDDFPGTVFEEIQAGLTTLTALALCGTDPDLIDAGCPDLPTDPGPGDFSVSCANCTDEFNATSQIVLVRACQPYHCPVQWNVSCNYTYVTNTSVITHNLITTQEYSDGRFVDPPGTNLWNNGDQLCADVDPDEAEWQAIQCDQQQQQGDPCAPGNSTLTGFNATQVGGFFPSDQVSFCGAPYTCVSENVTTCSCDINEVAPCLSEYEVGNGSAMCVGGSPVLILISIFLGSSLTTSTTDSRSWT